MTETTTSIFAHLLIAIGLSYAFYTYAPEGRALSSFLLSALFTVISGLCFLAYLVGLLVFGDTPIVLLVAAAILALTSVVYYEMYRFHFNTHLHTH